MGFIFWSEIYLNNMSGMKNEDGLDQRQVGIKVLQYQQDKHPKRHEAYLRLWQIYQYGLQDFNNE